MIGPVWMLQMLSRSAESCIVINILFFMFIFFRVKENEPKETALRIAALRAALCFSKEADAVKLASLKQSLRLCRLLLRCSARSDGKKRR